MASASVEKVNPLFVKGKCFHDCEAELIVGPEKIQIYVCMENLAKLSDYFRVMFLGDFKEKKQKEFKITDETPEDMICFFNAIDSDPDIRKITDDSIQLLMRLADKFQCDLLKKYLKNHIQLNGPSCESTSTIFNWLLWSQQYNMPEEMVKFCLDIQKISDDTIEFLMYSADKHQCDVMKERLKQYIEINEPACQNVSTILNWLVWSLQYHMPEEVIKMCLPGVACLSLSSLHTYRERLGWELYGKVLDVKMQLKCKTTDLYKAKITLASSFKCSSCGLIDHLPYRIQWCKATIHTYFRCPSCLEVGYSHCCEKCDFYYKCPDCPLDPLSYRNKEQCPCKRKNYGIMLKEIP